MDAYVIGYSTFLNGGTVGFTRDTADIRFACDAGVGEMDALHCATDFAKEALIIIGSSFAVSIDADAADGVSLSVVSALEWMVTVANAGEVILFAAAGVPLGGVREG